jgi:hypothetical protein
MMNHNPNRKYDASIGATIIGFILAAVLAASLGSMHIQLARAQTSSATTTTSGQQRTFQARGQISSLATASKTTSLTMSSLLNKNGNNNYNIAGGNWSLNVSNGRIQNFTLQLKYTQNPGSGHDGSAGKGIPSSQILGGITNVTPSLIVLGKNSTAFQGIVKPLDTNGGNASQKFKMEFSLANGFAVKIQLNDIRSATSTNTANSETDSTLGMHIYGTANSVTDAKGRNTVNENLFTVAC